ncbi:MAG: dTDP-4-dehydrorhamnose reductase [Anaerolineae bacterium]|nr:dTDP-4-dehydrorhamnose reductase [Anaerolineae bacterium]
MRILLAGHRGQLGRALMPLLMEAHDVRGVDLPDDDITDRSAMLDLARVVAPHVIINSAAMTDVDGCARDPALAYRVNGMGTQNLALASADVGAEFVQISTNEVFDGAATEPYHEWAVRAPINAYGRSKLAGEWYTENLLNRFYIVRTTWLYAAGGRNFPHRIIELADQRGALRVVEDEVGSPTYVDDLADAIVKLLETHAYGIYHLVNEGTTSRYEFAKVLLRHSGRESVPVTPISSSEFDRTSTPPPYAPLANTAAAALGIRLRPWEDAVAAFIDAAGYRR